MPQAPAVFGGSVLDDALFGLRHVLRASQEVLRERAEQALDKAEQSIAVLHGRRAVLLVSHDPARVERLCDTTVHLDQPVTASAAAAVC